MNTLKRIVAGIDFSVYSPEILGYAADIAKQNSAEIFAVSVINKRHTDAILTAISDQTLSTTVLEQFISDETQRRTQKMDALIKERVPQQVSVHTIIRIGVPFEEILQVVDDKDADLVVISSKGRTNFQDYMFGTTSEKIFRHCPVSLLSLNLTQ